MNPLSLSARFALCLAAATLLPVSIVSAQQPPWPMLTVTGEATVRAVPDTVMIRAGVTTQGKTAREASEANAKTMGEVIAALKTAGVADTDIQTVQLSVQPNFDTGRNGANKIVSFQASNTMSARLRAMDKVSDVIDAVIAAGANDMGGIDFIVADPSKLMDQARNGAIADARRKAELYAKAASVGLGRVMGISEDVPSSEPMMLRAAAPMAAKGTPVMPGEQTLQANITVTYQLIP